MLLFFCPFDQNSGEKSGITASLRAGRDGSLASGPPFARGWRALRVYAILRHGLYDTANGKSRYTCREARRQGTTPPYDSKIQGKQG